MCWCFFFLLFAGEDSLPSRILQHTDGTAGALDDEPHLVPEDLQGDGESPVQNEAQWKRKNRIGLDERRCMFFFFFFFSRMCKSSFH